MEITNILWTKYLGQEGIEMRVLAANNYQTQNLQKQNINFEGMNHITQESYEFDFPKVEPRICEWRSLDALLGKEHVNELKKLKLKLLKKSQWVKARELTHNSKISTCEKRQILFDFLKDIAEDNNIIAKKTVRERWNDFYKVKNKKWSFIFLVPIAIAGLFYAANTKKTTGSQISQQFSSVENKIKVFAANFTKPSPESKPVDSKFRSKAYKDLEKINGRNERNYAYLVGPEEYNKTKGKIKGEKGYKKKIDAMASDFLAKKIKSMGKNSAYYQLGLEGKVKGVELIFSKASTVEEYKDLKKHLLHVPNTRFKILKKLVENTNNNFWNVGCDTIVFNDFCLRFPPKDVDKGTIIVSYDFLKPLLRDELAREMKEAKIKASATMRAGLKGVIKK